MMQGGGARARPGRVWPFAVLLLLLAMPARAQPVAVEYYHAGFGHYFITANPQEAAALDTGQIKGWTRTGESFAVDGAANVCRFFSDTFAPKSSHFYTPYQAECNALRVGFVWTFEDLVFRVDFPDANGACSAGKRPLYRLYNDGRSGAPNHRYTVRADLAATMRSQGWIAEGAGPNAVFACVPGSAAPPPAAGPTGLKGNVQLAPGVRVLTEAEASLIVSLSETQAVFAQSIGLAEGNVFIVPERGGFRVVSIADEGRSLAVTPASLDEMFAEIELEGTVALAIPGASAAQSSGTEKAYLTPKPAFYSTYLDGEPGVKAEFKLLASCSNTGTPSFEFVDVKVGFYGRPSVKVSKRSGTYEVSAVRVVAETTLRLGCKIKDSSDDSVWVKVPIATSVPGVAFRLDFGGAIGWETDIAPVVQLAYAKVDGTVDVHRNPVFAATVNGNAFDKATILATIGGTTGLSFTGKLYPSVFGKLVLTALSVDLAGVRVRTGPEIEVKAVFAAQSKLCGKLEWKTEVHAILPRLASPYDLVERLLFRNEPEIPTGFDLDCTTPTQPPPTQPPPGPMGPTGDWVFTRNSCDISPPGCGTCPNSPLNVRMTEATGGATIGWSFLDFPGDPGMTINRQTTSQYQGCYQPIPGFVSCAAVGFDLPQKRTATLGSALVFGTATGTCTVSAGWQGAMR